MKAMKKAIEDGSVERVRQIVDADPSAATQSIVWGKDGKNQTPPLHYLCDMVFQERIDQEQSVQIANALLEAGVDPNQSYAKSGDTYLITAASLHAGRIGLRLLEANADVHARGLFGATALHWAATTGGTELAEALIRGGSDVALKDQHYGSTPLQWALHARDQAQDKTRFDPVIALLQAQPNH